MSARLWRAGGFVLLAVLLAFQGIRPPTGGYAGEGLNLITRFLIAVAVIILVCQLLGGLVQRLGQPRVIGEILGGVLLGPSLLGALSPAGTDWLFPAEVRTALQMTAQLGLVVFMYLLGHELRLSEVRSRRATVGGVVLGAMGLPVVAGAGLAYTELGGRAGGGQPPLAFAAFFGLALGITALPVLARVLVDLRLDGTPLGALALVCAACGDAIMWAGLTMLLAMTGIASGENILTGAVLAGALALITVLCVRPALRALASHAELRADGNLLLTVLLAGAIGFSVATVLMGLHPVIGAFIFGAVVPRGAPAVARVNRQLRGFAMAVLLPVFFAGVGLSTSLSLLGRSVQHWLLFAAVLVVASGAKYLGTVTAARLTGVPQSESRQLGVMLNCRGVTELIIATIGLQYGFINPLGFTILVLMAMVTTVATGPLVRALTPRRAEPEAIPIGQQIATSIDTVGAVPSSGSAPKGR